jgi:hypothetical protein
MASSLVMRRRSKAPRAVTLKLDARQKTIETQVEVQTGLLAIRDHIKPCCDLIRNGNANGIVLDFRDVICAELVKVLGCKLKPTWERVGPDDGGSEGNRGHGLF